MTPPLPNCGRCWMGMGFGETWASSLPSSLTSCVDAVVRTQNPCLSAMASCSSRCHVTMRKYRLKRFKGGLFGLMVLGCQPLVLGSIDYRFTVRPNITTVEHGRGSPPHNGHRKGPFVTFQDTPGSKLRPPLKFPPTPSTAQPAEGGQSKGTFYIQSPLLLKRA